MQETLASEPPDRAALFRRAEAAEAEGRTERAIAAYEQVLQLDADDADAWERLGSRYLENGEFERAARALSRRLQLRPDDAWAHFHLGMIARGVDRPAPAIEALRRALVLQPDNGEFRVNLGAALGAAGWWDEAARLLGPMGEGLPGWWAQMRDTALRVHATHRRQLLELLQMRRGQGRAVDLGRDLAIGRLLLASGRVRAAEGLGERLLTVAPDHPDAITGYASVLARRRGLGAAMDFMTQVTARHPGLPACHRLLAELRHQAGDLAGALAALEPVRDEVDENTLASTLFAAAQWDRLLVHARGWMDRTPDTRAHKFAIAAYRRSGVVRPLDEPDGADAAVRDPPPWLKIVQFWDDDPPQDVAAAMSTWPQMHPGTPYEVYDETDAKRFILGTFGSSAVEAFEACRHASMKSDFFRISYLSVHGGVYVDADEQCLRPLWPVVRALQAGATFVGALSSEPLPYVHSAFLAAPPGSSMFREAFRRLVEGIRAHPRPNIWDAAGPGLITRAVARIIADNQSGNEQVILLRPGQYTSFSKCLNLEYKFTAKGNWRLLED